MNLISKANNKNLDFKIALDGPVASGKGLISSMIAKEFNLKSVQSSIIYRGLAYICIKDKIDLNNTNLVIYTAENKDIISQVRDIDLNTELIGDMASKIASIYGVRKILTKYLATLVSVTPRIIMEGRDIGTIVAPGADVKIFILADIKVRAIRRYNQLQSQGKYCTIDDVLKLLRERDKRDKNRMYAPLKPVRNSLIIDTSKLNPGEVILKVKKFIYR